MSSRTILAGLAVPGLIFALAPATQAAPAPLAPPPPPRTAPPALAIEAGDSVFDRTGLEVGKVRSLVETPAGAMIVASIDGKLISLPQSTLRLDGSRVVSVQTKAQMIAAAGAPG